MSQPNSDEQATDSTPVDPNAEKADIDDTPLLEMAVVCPLGLLVLAIGLSNECVDGLLWSGIVGAVMVGLILFCYPRWWVIVACVLCVLVAIGFMLPASGAAREVPKERWPCDLRASSIQLALQNYEREHGTFPPAYIADANGKPMHSWRVLILPFFGDETCDRLYRQYDFNEPWGGPNNKRLLATCPEFYRCRHALPTRTPETTTTSYVAVVGSNAAWSGQEAINPKRGKLAENWANTVMLIEVPAAAGIQWTEPKDLCVDTLTTAGIWPVEPIVHQRTRPKHFFYYYDSIGPPRASIAFVNGCKNSLPEECLTAERLTSLLKIGGCSEEDCNLMNSRTQGVSHMRLRWFNCSVYAAWIVAVVILPCRTIRNRKEANCQGTASEH